MLPEFYAITYMILAIPPVNSQLGSLHKHGQNYLRSLFVKIWSSSMTAKFSNIARIISA